MEVFQIEPDLMSTLEDLDQEGLSDFAALYEGLKSDSEIEVAIFIHLLLFTKSSSPEFLERALQRAMRWAEATEVKDPDRSRRFQIVDMVLAMQLTHNEPLER